MAWRLGVNKLVDQLLPLAVLHICIMYTCTTCFLLWFIHPCVSALFSLFSLFFSWLWICLWCLSILSAVNGCGIILEIQNIFLQAQIPRRKKETAKNISFGSIALINMLLGFAREILVVFKIYLNWKPFKFLMCCVLMKTLNTGLI